MKGFNIHLLFSILLGSILLSSCIPQAKKTECADNEAYNSSRRACLPIVPNQDGFITFTSATPSYPVTVSATSGYPISLSFAVNNAYGRNYRIRWIKSFNGSVSTLVSPSTASPNLVDHPYSLSVVPATDLLSAIGTHVITAQILDTNLSILDTQDFQIVLVNNPTPFGNGFLPTLTVPVSRKTNPASNDTFSFAVYKNGATLSNPRIQWTLDKLTGTPLTQRTQTDTISFPTPTTGIVVSFSIDSSNPMNSGTPPSAPFNELIGTYRLNATIIDGTDVYATYSWDYVIAHPNIGVISSASLPTPAVSGNTITAYNGIGYDNLTLPSFSYSSGSTRAQMCVTISDPDGRYGSGVNVSYYLGSNAAPIYTGTTSGIDNTICLEDAPGATKTLVAFSDPNFDLNWTTSIRARVFDVDTLEEYASYTGGSYPPVWALDIRPQNKAPTVSFTADGNLSGMSCGSAVGSNRTCSVTQDAPFTIGVYVNDEFYNSSSTTDSEQDKFTYSMTLYQDSSVLGSCQKATTDVADTDVPNSDYVGPDYLCQFTVPSYNASGPINPTLHTYSVSISVSDTGSPFAPSTPKASTVLTYTLNVSETNTAPSIDPQGATTSDSYIANSLTPTTVIQDATNEAFFINEGQTLNFNVIVSDSQRDNHQVKVSLCTDFTSSCTTSSLVATTNVTKTNGNIDTTSVLSYTLPEDLIPITTPLGTNVDVFFKIESSDFPDTLSSLSATPEIFSVNVRNYNPAPQFSGVANPLTTASLTVMSGYPLTIDPGTVTDNSVPSSEAGISHQWYVDADGAGASDFAAISGSTSRILRWTPSMGIAAGSIIYLRLCTTDNTVVNTLPTLSYALNSAPHNNANGVNCIGDWQVTVKPNTISPPYSNGIGGDLDPDMAIWQDTTIAGKRVVYSAYSDNDKIYIEKTIFESNGNIYNLSNPGFETVSFNALSTGAVASGSIKDISLAGDNDYLYIAYQAADSSTPSNPRIKIRRIDKRNNVVTDGTKTDSTYPHNAKFGYRYSQNLPTVINEALPGTFNIAAVTLGSSYTVQFTGALTAADEISINGISFLATAPESVTTLCAGSGCSPAGNASKLASLINNSSNRNLQGLSATSSGDTMTINGAVGGEHLDSNNISNYVVGKLGKLIVYGGNWYLPFIDLSTFGSIQKIRVLTQSTSAQLNASLIVTDSVVYSGIGTVNWFTNEMAPSGNMIIASINTSNVAKIHSYDLLGVLVDNTTLFGGSPVASEQLRISVPTTGNSYYFAAAKVLTSLPSTYDWMFGHYDSGLNTVIEQTFATASLNSETSNVLTTSEVIDINLKSMPNSTEARMLVSSTNLGADVNLYSLRFRSDYKLSCGICSPLNYGAQVLSSAKEIAATPIDIDMTIGTAGNVANENQKDVLFTVYSVDSDSNNVFEPIFGIINMESEPIQSTSTDTTGTLGHRPPFIGPN